MSDTKHTPGPWKAVKMSHVDDQLWLTIVDLNGRGPVCRPQSPGQHIKGGAIAEIQLVVTPEEEIWANAELIASAPDMAVEIERLKAVQAELVAMFKYYIESIQSQNVANIQNALDCLKIAIANAEKGK